MTIIRDPDAHAAIATPHATICQRVLVHRDGETVTDPAWVETPEQEVARLKAENAELHTQLRDALTALDHCRERILELGHMLGTGGK